MNLKTFLFCIPTNSLHYSSFNLSSGSRSLSEKYSPPPTTLLNVLIFRFQDSVLLVFGSSLAAKNS